MRETIGEKNSQTKGRKKKWGSNLDVSTRRKKRNKIKRPNIIYSTSTISTLDANYDSSLSRFTTVTNTAATTTCTNTTAPTTISIDTTACLTISDYSDSDSDDELDSKSDYTTSMMAIYCCCTNVLHWPDRSQWIESAKTIRKSLQIPANIIQCIYVPIYVW